MEKKKVMDQGKGNGEWGRYREESCTFKQASRGRPH